MLARQVLMPVQELGGEVAKSMRPVRPNLVKGRLIALRKHHLLDGCRTNPAGVEVGSPVLLERFRSDRGATYFTASSLITTHTHPC